MKKRYKILIITVLVLIFVPLVAYLFLRTSSVQTYLTHKITKYISDKYHVKISVGGVDIAFFNKVILEDVYLGYQRKDTFAFVPQLKLFLQGIDRKKQWINVSKVQLVNARIKLYEVDSTEITNIEKFVDAFSTGETDTTPSNSNWKIRCNKLELQNTKFSYRFFKPDTVEYGFNYTDIGVDSLNLILSSISIKDKIKVKIEDMQAKEKSGFRIRHFFGDVTLYEKGVFIDSIAIKTNQSSIYAKKFSFQYNRWGEFPDFLTKVKMNATFVDSTQISSEDVAYFAPTLRGLHQTVRVKGKVSGYVNKLKSNDLMVYFGKHSFVNLNFDISNLPDVDNMFIFADIKDLETNKEDLETIKLYPFNGKKYIELPESMKNVGNIHYQGNFYGLLTDFATKGSLTSNYGNLTTDFRLAPNEKEKNGITFSGKLTTDNFHLGIFSGTPDYLGRTTLNMQVEGSSSAKGEVKASVAGLINSLEINKYPCQNIRINGEVANKKFEGNVSVDDKNLRAGFTGKCNLENALPLFDFQLALDYVNLYKFNIVPKDSLASGSVLIKANIQGNTPENLKGSLELNSITYTTTPKEYKLGDIFINIKDVDTTKKLYFVSDFCDINATIEGKFKYEELAYSFNNLIYKYLPSLIGTKIKIDDSKTQTDSLSNISLDLTVKDASSVLEIFAPQLHIDTHTTLVANYTPLNDSLSMLIESPRFVVAGKTFTNLKIKSKTLDNQFDIQLNSDTLFLNKDQFVCNFSATNKVEQDNIGWHLFWDNKQQKENTKGDIVIKTQLKNDNNRLIADIQLFPSQIVFSDMEWKLSGSSVHIDTSFVQVNNFNFSNKDQSFTVNGIISENPKDELNVDLVNIDMANLNLLTENAGYKFKGLLNGKARVSDVYNKLEFNSDVEISNLFINEENLGNTSLKSAWYNNEQRLHLETYTGIISSKNVDINGDFYLETKKLDFLVKLKLFPLDIVQPFLKGMASGIVGRARGEIAVKGTTDKPLLSGKLELQKVGFTFDFLNTRYTFTHEVEIRPNGFFFKNVKINPSLKDPALFLKNPKMNLKSYLGDSAIVDGEITHENFNNIRFVVKINAKNLLLLDTKENENPYFYGRAFATGMVQIHGTTDEVNIDALAKTEKGTKFCVPLSSGAELSETTDFLTFVKKGTTQAKKEFSDYQVSTAGVKLDLNLQVTPDAEAQLVFDEKVGDVIKGRGTGNINLKINSLGNFSMSGEYIIEKGDYLFTLKNIINKHFEVQRGGRIKWDGDPMNATIDLNAVYSLRKVSIYDLLLESSLKDLRVPVNCNLMMKDKLLKPTVTFGITFPERKNIDDRVLSEIDNLTEDELNKQMLSLLIINSFMPLTGLNPSSENISSSSNAVNANAYELLSNQLSHWLSQISNKFDIGVKYKPGDEISKNQVEVALSTQLWNDRITISTNVGLSGQTTDKTVQTTESSSNNQIVGDFEVNYKLTPSGKMSVKSFAKSNENKFNYETYYSYGVGLSYKEEFDSFSELMKSYAQKLKRDTTKKK